MVKCGLSVSIMDNTFKSYGHPPHLFQLIPQESHSYNTLNSEDTPTYHYRIDLFKNSFFPWIICKWNKHDLDICKSTYSIFIFIH